MDGNEKDEMSELCSGIMLDDTEHSDVTTGREENETRVYSGVKLGDQ